MQMQVRPVDIVLLAGWAGLLAGLLEGFAAAGLQWFGWPRRVPAAILWVAPAVNVTLLVIVGAALAAVARVAPPRLFGRLAVTTILWVCGFAVVQAVDVMRPASGLILALGIAVAATRRPGAFDRWHRRARRSLKPVVITATVSALIGASWSPIRERVALAALADPPPAVPNVVLVTLDTLRADHISTYGYGRRTTPHLDDFSTRGVLFEHAFSNSSWTLPTHASLLTGRFPHEHSANWLQPMDRRWPTLAETLAAKGYRTAAFAANTYYVAPEWGLGDGFSRFDVYGHSAIDLLMRTAYGRRLALNVPPRFGYFDTPGRTRAEHLNSRFLKWIDDDRSRPFFALLNYLDVHDPYVTEPAYHKKYSAAAAAGNLINRQRQPHGFRTKASLTSEEIRAEIDAYDGCVSYLDFHLGRLFEALTQRDLTRNTLIVLTSDHGESFGNHDLFGHGNSLYLEALHVPLVIVWPGGVPAGVRVDEPVGLERVAATIDALVTRTQSSSSFPGDTLASLWTSEPVHAADSVPVLSEVSKVNGGPPPYPTSQASLTSLITTDWHVIVSDTGGAELYAWRTDPEERRNLATDSRAQAVLPELIQWMTRLRQHTRVP